MKGLRLKGDSVRDIKVKEEKEGTVFMELEATRARLEEELGMAVFIKAYRMVEAWQEAEVDDETQRLEIEKLLGDADEVQSVRSNFQALLRLVIRDTSHFDTSLLKDAV